LTGITASHAWVTTIRLDPVRRAVRVTTLPCLALEASRLTGNWEWSLAVSGGVRHIVQPGTGNWLRTIVGPMDREKPPGRDDLLRRLLDRGLAPVTHDRIEFVNDFRASEAVANLYGHRQRRVVRPAQEPDSDRCRAVPILGQNSPSTLSVTTSLFQRHDTSAFASLSRGGNGHSEDKRHQTK
jgi:hypothetical protein